MVRGIIVVFLVVGGAGWYVLQAQRYNSPQQSSTKSLPLPTSTPTAFPALANTTRPIPITNGQLQFTDSKRRSITLSVAQKFVRAYPSPDVRKILLEASHGGGDPTGISEHAIINIDGSGYFDLPANFEEGGFYLRFWSDDSKNIIETSGVGEEGQQLIAFNADTGKESVFAQAPKNISIDACQYMNHVLSCKLRDINQIIRWSKVVNGTFL